MQPQNDFPQNAIYVGSVFHERHRPFSHKLKYRVFAYFLDLDTLENLDQTRRWFSFNRFNLCSIHNRDHGPSDGTALRPWIESAARSKGLDVSESRIFMLSFPRLWGYVFNPLTIFFCYGQDAQLHAILYQVKNTFGEQHGYFLPVSQSNKIAQDCQKVFHVSPFIEMDCEYQFRLSPPDETLNIAIHQFVKEGKMLTAVWTGARHDFSDPEILKALLHHPLMTFKVIAGIHWEAIKLLIKGAKYIRKPPPPSQEIT
jgi:DUF1365 family protein